MLSSEARMNILYGLSKDMNAEVKEELSKHIDDAIKYFDDLNNNKSSTKLFGQKGGSKKVGTSTDSQYFTNLSDMINGDNRFVEECGDMLNALVAKNKKYYSVIKDYQIMDILIPQINRVMMFLINECISPDIQNKRTFDIKYISDDNKDAINQEITAIRDELELDTKLRQVYESRFKLGREYNAVINYTQTYEKATEMLNTAKLNEAAGLSLNEAFDQLLTPLTESIDTVTFQINEPCYDKDYSEVKNSIVEVSLSDLNIQIERSPVVTLLKDARDQYISETASSYSMDNVLASIGSFGLNEASYANTGTVLDKDRIFEIIKNLDKKKLDRCMIRHFDPSKIFKLTACGRTIGYFYIEDIDEQKTKAVNIAQGLKDRLLKSRVANLNQSYTDAEDIISKQLAEKIIKTFDPNIGINRIEDIDLLHNYLITSGIANGNKKITFYYKDDIYDMSRTGDSILTNAVFFTKLYATLMLNNVMTKILRGRGRQIHTVNLGASPMAQKYVMNAMAALTMPENNLGTLHGSFEQLLNPLNSASDIVIPAEDNTEQYIRTDYIEGQNVDMDNDFLKFLLNSIVSSFGLDPAVLDATNGNIQFAKTLAMESVQICILIMNEQNDLIRPWTGFVLKCLEIEGSEKLQEAIKSGLVEVKFFTPKSLTLQLMADEINNAKNSAEAIADVIPLFNAVDGPEIDFMRSEYIFSEIRRNTNLDWTTTLATINDAQITAQDLELQKDILEAIRNYKENTQEKDIDTLGEEDLEDENLDTSDNMDTEEEPDMGEEGEEMTEEPAEGETEGEETPAEEEPAQEDEEDIDMDDLAGLEDDDDIEF